MLLLGQAEPALRASIAAWAAGRGWTLRELPAPDGSELRSAAIVVTVGGEAALPALAESGIPVVAVDLDAQPGQHLSTVGEPGARHEQAGFLAGALAALVTQSSQVGLIADPATEYPQAFLLGLRYHCVRCELVELAPGQAGADAFRAQAVDVIGVAPGAAAGAAAESLAGLGFRWVLVDQPGEAYPAGELAGRVAFEPGPLAAAALEALFAGEPGQAWPYAAELGGIQLADVGLSPGRQEVLQAVLQALGDGSLDPGAGAESTEIPPP